MTGGGGGVGHSGRRGELLAADSIMSRASSGGKDFEDRELSSGILQRAALALGHNKWVQKRQVCAKWDGKSGYCRVQHIQKE